MAFDLDDEELEKTRTEIYHLPPKRKTNNKFKKLSSVIYLLENLRDVNLQDSVLRTYSGDIKSAEVLKTQSELIDAMINELEESINKQVILDIIRELTGKLAEPNSDRFELDDEVYYNNIKAQIRICKEILKRGEERK